MRILELLGSAIAGREAIASERLCFASPAPTTDPNRCVTGRPVRLIALRDLDRLPVFLRT